MSEPSLPHGVPYKPGSVLDGWVIEAPLGAGGMGVVYQATHERSGMLAALKVLPSSPHGGAEILQRFRREVKALARIRHPSVVNILQESLDHDPPYFAMELLPGGSLSSRIDAAGAPGGKPLSAAFLTQIARQLAEGLAAIHNEHIVHRDIKPQNVLFSEDGHAKFADFGMAKALDLTGLTVANRVMGTLPYMAPEALQGKPADSRTDFYQLGVTLFEAATGQRPYAGEDLVGVLAGRPLPPLPRLADHAVQCPAWYQGVLDRLTAFRPEDRYSTAQEILDDIERGVLSPRRNRSLDQTMVPPLTPVPPLVRTRAGSVPSPVMPRASGPGPVLTRPSGPGSVLQRASGPREVEHGTTSQLRILVRVASRSVWLVPVLGVFVLACAVIAWQLNRGGNKHASHEPEVPRAESPPPPVNPQKPAPRLTSPALPPKPVVVELPNALVMFGKGRPPQLRPR
ncbi:MAG: serine/threonine protein kinase, partial [Candidatus Wallbacteria bacterium]|nr:serine/threonine protein kinase [Candidatus Wallbacteria bacterium]